MNTNPPNPISAYIGIAGAVGMAVSDVILLSVPMAGWESDMSSFSSLAHVSLMRMTIGPLIGLISSFFICFGFWHVSRKLAHLNERLAMVMFISLVSVMFLVVHFTPDITSQDMPYWSAMLIYIKHLSRIWRLCLI